MDIRHWRSSNYYSPHGLLKIFTNPHFHNETHCWEVDISSLLTVFLEHLNSTEDIEFNEAALILQGAGVLYAKKISSLDKDICVYHNTLSSYSRVEENVQKQQNEQEPVLQPDAQETAPNFDVVQSNVEEQQTPRRKKEKKTDETTAIDKVTSVVKPEDINSYLDDLFTDLQKTFRQYGKHDVEESDFYKRLPIFTTIDKRQRRKCCELLLKHLCDKEITLLAAFKGFLHEEDVNTNVAKSETLKMYERKRFLAAKLSLLVDIRSGVFIPNLHQDVLYIRVCVRKFLYNELVRLSVISVYDTPKSVGGGDFELENRNEDDDNCVVNSNSFVPLECKVVVIPLPDEMMQIEDSSSDSNQGVTITEIQDDNSNVQSSLNETGEKVDNFKVEETISEDTEVDGTLDPSEEETEALLNDCVAVRECQDNTAMTVNNVQFQNMFGLSRRLLRKSCYFRLPNDIFDWARSNMEMVLILRKKDNSTKIMSRTKITRSSIMKNKKILKLFVTNNKSENNVIHFKKLQSPCFVPLVSLPISDGDNTNTPQIMDTTSDVNHTVDTTDLQTTHTEDATDLECTNTESLTIADRESHFDSEIPTGELSSNEVCEENTTHEITQTTLNESSDINESMDLTLTQQSCPESGEGEDTMETDSCKTLTQDSNIESGIYMDTTSKDNTPSFNTTRNNSFFSELQDDIMTHNDNDDNQIILDINKTFDREDGATQQLESVPEGNVLNKIAETMQQCQEKEKQLLEMFKRVENWHQHIRGKLLQSKRRENWDIHAYEDRLLHKIPEQPETLHFAVLTGGKSREEISRNFLSILTLATEGNIDIISGNGDSLETNNILLSKKPGVARHHETIDAAFKKMSQQEEIPPAMSTESSSEVSETENMEANESSTVKKKLPFLYRRYGESDSSDDEISKLITKNPGQSFDDTNDSSDDYDYLNRNNHADDYDDRPPKPRTRGRKRKVRKVQEKTVYRLNNESCDSSDIDEFIEKAIQSVNVIEGRGKQTENYDEMNNNNDLPVILRAPEGFVYKGLNALANKSVKTSEDRSKQTVSDSKTNNAPQIILNSNKRNSDTPSKTRAAVQSVNTSEDRSKRIGSSKMINANAPQIILNTLKRNADGSSKANTVRSVIAPEDSNKRILSSTKTTNLDPPPIILNTRKRNEQVSSKAKRGNQDNDSNSESNSKRRKVTSTNTDEDYFAQPGSSKIQGQESEKPDSVSKYNYLAQPGPSGLQKKQTSDFSPTLRQFKRIAYLEESDDSSDIDDYIRITGEQHRMGVASSTPSRKRNSAQLFDLNFLQIFEESDSDS